ncbi:hypothetical protein J5289_16240 [Rhizobium sp. B230/85]|uniref:hypothetical protein n=1 Tax=unclassified Rhizobium TaxID=2613769 RepID=UPI001ADD0CF6|nr:MULTISPECIES: hypothetical protein [unclassified Rhizobium]MBO9131726.1 hypothetical protein [Rhizobium sp. B209b/85]QXZ95706.1 hypothetical protein J5289_16240 [Rhizobium sp. B230/85]
MTKQAIADPDPHEELLKLDAFYEQARRKLAEQVAQADRISAEQKLAADDADRGKRMDEATEMARMLVAESASIDRLLLECSERLATRRNLARDIQRLIPERIGFGNAFEHSNVIVSAITASGVGHFTRAPLRGAMKLQAHDLARLNMFGDLTAKAGRK